MEIEAKFILPDAKTLRRLRTIKTLAGFSLSPGRVVQDHDTFLDTPRRQILSAGHVCRRREREGEYIFTLKKKESTIGAIHKREELEIVLPADLPPAQWPDSPIRERVLQLIGEEPLRPLFKQKQRRMVRLVQREDKVVAELSLDDVHVAVGDLALESQELEIELKGEGAEADLAALVTCLQGEWKLQPEPRSKFERGLEFVTANAAPRPVKPKLVRAAPPARRARPKKILKPGIELDDAMSEAGRKTLLFHFQRMVEHEEATRAGQDIEALHDMRVAARRMRAALRIFEGYLDKETLKPFGKSLRRLGRVLGAVRDLDVFHVKAQQYLDGLAVERRGELEPLLAAWQKEYNAARKDLVVYLDSEGYQQFKETFGIFLQTPGAGVAPIMSGKDAPLPYRVRHVLPAIMLKSWARVRVYEEWMSGPNVELARYHQLRIASKGTRYTLEFFGETLSANAGGLIEQMKTLQDHLGKIQDCMVACGILRDFLTWGIWRRDLRKVRARREVIVAPGVAAYLATRQTEIQELVKAFPPIWSVISSPEFNQRLAALVEA
ncbi:MAG TPA: CHAD domain-containing protein [Anaerolineae bacterium]